MTNTKDTSKAGVFSDVPGLADAVTTAVTGAILEAPILLNGESPDPELVAKLKRELGCCGQCGSQCRASQAARKG
jgi:hypothetical protein